MGWTHIRAIAGMCICGALVVWNARIDGDVAIAQTPRPITLTHVFTGADGMSHMEAKEIPLTPTGDADLSEMAKVNGLQFRRQRSTYFQDFHPASRKQYVVTLRGEGEIELANGQKIVARAGDVWLMEDVTGKGHISRGRGTDDRITLFIPVAAD
jgi:hypothetical protein